MKILCVIDSLGSGGAQRQLVGLARLLKEHLFEVKLIWYHFNDFYQPYLDEHGIDYEKGHSKGKLAKIRYIRRIMEEFHPDIVIAYIDGPTMIACLLRLLGAKFKLIVSERNTTQSLNIHERLKFYLYRWADAIVPNSYSQNEYIRKNFSLLKSKVYPITNFVETDTFFPQVSTNKSFSGCRMIVVGRIVEQKNVLTFLEAVRIIVDNGCLIEVHWYGKPFTQTYYDMCLAKRKELGLEHIVSFHGESNDIRTAYCDSDVFCLPSLYEGFPNVVCEAMACGLPILCSRVCDNPLIVEESKNGFLFEPSSAEDIADTFIRFQKLSTSEKEAMKKHSRKLAEDKFSEGNFISQYMKVIQKVSQK